jgi:hypothetical protein
MVDGKLVLYASMIKESSSGGGAGSVVESGPAEEEDDSSIEQTIRVVQLQGLELSAASSSSESSSRVRTTIDCLLT